MKSMLVVMLLIAAPAIARNRKVNPEDFTLQAAVTNVTSQREMSTISTKASVPYYCGHPQGSFQEGYCAQAKNQHYSTTSDRTIYTMETRIGDKVYDLEGPRLELGPYQARFDHNGVDILMHDKKGRPASIYFSIAGEHLSNLDANQGLGTKKRPGGTGR